MEFLIAERKKIERKKGFKMVKKGTANEVGNPIRFRKIVLGKSNYFEGQLKGQL